MSALGELLVSVIPPKGKEPEYESTGVRLPSDLIARLKEIASAEGYSRNEVIIFLLNWAVRAYDQEKADEKKPKKGH